MNICMDIDEIKKISEISYKNSLNGSDVVSILN